MNYNKIHKLQSIWSTVKMILKGISRMEILDFIKQW